MCLQLLLLVVGLPSPVPPLHAQSVPAWPLTMLLLLLPLLPQCVLLKCLLPLLLLQLLGQCM